jgi:chemotaxis protein methyltransferase CheR
MSTISAERWVRVSEVVAEATGLHFPPDRFDDLQRGVTSSASALGFDDVAACADWIGSAPLAPKHVQILASHLTVGETYFFRDRNTYDAFAGCMLEDIVRERRNGSRRLRIWSAACCTGEEPYSLAMALRQALPHFSKWDVTILATDINPVFLEKAAAGIYGEWSFRAESSDIKARYFRRTADGRYAVIPEIRAMVKFAPLNLMAFNAYPSPATDTQVMDIIFCRNALMYFAPAAMRKVIGKLHDALIPGGWLAVSPSEASHALFKQFVLVKSHGALLYRKSVADAPDVPAWSWTPVAPKAAEAPDEPVDTGAPTTAFCTATPEACAAGARMHANLGELEQALAWCERWTAVDKLDPRSHYLRAVILFEQGSLVEARGALQRALFLQPDFVLAHYTLGNLASRSGEDDGARRHYTNALLLLNRHQVDDLVPESEGLTAGRLTETITSMMMTISHDE